MMRRVLRAAVLALAALSLAAGAAAAPRTVAVGDIHGAIDAFRAILERSGLIDGEGRWIGGDAVLVQTGDFTDRGAGVRQVMDLLMRLQDEAPAAGGRVHVLLGNHEAMNLVAQYRDVGPEAWAAFVDGASEKRRRAAYKQWKKHVRRRYNELELGTPRFTDEVEASWMAAYPPGYLEYHAAFLPEGRYGAWLRERPVAVRVGGTLFVHGGLAPALAAADLEELNRAAAEEVARFDRFRRELLERGLILPFSGLDEILMSVGRPATPAEEAGEPGGAADEPATGGAADEPLTVAVAEEPPAAGEADELVRLRDELVGSIENGLLFGPNGPLWFRGYATWPEEQLTPLVDAVRQAQGVERVVSGHTPSLSGSIQTRLEQRIVLIDTGMLSSVYPGGRASALEIGTEGLAFLYLDPPETAPAAGGLIPSAPAPDLPPAAAAQAQPAPAAAPAGGPWLGPDLEPLPFAEEAELLDFLRNARILEVTEVGRGVTRPKRLLLERDGVRARAIFHDVHIERTRARMQGAGMVGDFRDRYVANLAAYRLARLLGLDNVPPTVLRELDGKEGSVALWIEDSFDEEDRKAQGLEAPDRTLWVQTFQDMRIFDNLIHNIDRNQGNIVYDRDWKAWWVDHTRAFGIETRLGEPKFVTRCSRSFFEAIRALDPDEVMDRLSPPLSRREVKSLLKRRDRLVEMLEERIERLGEGLVLLPDPPRPGGGPR